jgi:hypothetical protein
MDRYYRCYFLGGDDKFKDFVDFAAPDDQTATAKAQQYFDNQREFVGFELWEGGRCVCSRPEPEAKN